MLLALYDAPFLRMSGVWSNTAEVPGAKNVANLHVCETHALAKWWLAGMNTGSTALFSGICAQCATLLHGQQYVNDATSNKTCAPPTDRDGNILPRDQVNAQPPFLLRYRPALSPR